MSEKPMQSNLSCGCVIYDYGNKFEWCPLHAAASELLKVAKDIVIHNPECVGRCSMDKLHTAIKKAEGK